MRKTMLVTFFLVAALLAMATETPVYANLFDTILERGVIRIGVQGGVPPFGEYDERGELVGLDVDLATKLAADLGVRLEMVPVETFDRIPFLQSRQVDLMIAVLSRTAERQKQIDFSIPYVVTGPVAVTRKDRTDINGVEDLVGQRVAIVPGQVSTIWVRRLQPNAIFEEFLNEPDQLTALRLGQVDALVQDSTLAAIYVKRYPDELRIASEEFYRDYIAIGVPKGEHDLRNWVNWWLFEQHNLGFIAQLWEKYFGGPQPDMMVNPFF